jgi:hypothetical protein
MTQVTVVRSLPNFSVEKLSADLSPFEVRLCILSLWEISKLFDYVQRSLMATENVTGVFAVYNPAEFISVHRPL